MGQTYVIEFQLMQQVFYREKEIRLERGILVQ